jgi:glycosyltransferase involved in cell wall biosynthesis
MSGLAHLLDHDADYQTRRLCEALAASRIQDITQTIKVIGRHQVISAARWLSQTRGIGVVHAWGINGLKATVLAGCRSVVYSRVPEARACPPGWLTWLANRRRVTVIGEVSPHPSPLPEYRERGQEGRSPSLIRQELGLSDDDFVILAPGESTRGARHEIAVWSVTMLHELNPRWRLLVWGRGTQAESVIRLAERLGLPQLLCLAPQAEFEQLPALADVALVTATPSAATLPIAMVMAGGIATVATMNSPAAKWVGEGGTVEDAPRAIAQKLIDIRANALMRQDLACASRERAGELFSWVRFLGEHAELYRKVSAHRQSSDRR